MDIRFWKTADPLEDCNASTKLVVATAIAGLNSLALNDGIVGMLVSALVIKKALYVPVVSVFTAPPFEYVRTPA